MSESPDFRSRPCPACGEGNHVGCDLHINDGAFDAMDFVPAYCTCEHTDDEYWGYVDGDQPNEDWLATRVLVCGDRNWTDQLVVGTILGGLLESAETSFGHLVVIEGCARGADSFACHFFDGGDPTHPCVIPGTSGRHAGHLSVKHEHYPADWEQYGKKAGPIRNRQMLKEGRPQIVFAFHDDLDNSKGTKDMVGIAKKAGLPVYVVSHG